MSDPAILAPPERLDSGPDAPPSLIDARDLAVTFQVEGGSVEAVKAMSFQLRRGEDRGIAHE